MILVFDTETNGFVKDFSAPFSDHDKFPRITQLAYSIIDEVGNELETYCELIKPDGWEIPAEEFFINNGFSTATNDLLGIPIQDAINVFIQAIDKAEVLVAHNLAFDQRTVGYEMFRLGLKAEKKPKFCTMLNTVNLCNIPNKWGKPKFPKLEELYDFLFSEKMENAHDALGDVRATARCFVALYNRGLLPQEILSLLPIQLHEEINYNQDGM